MFHFKFKYIILKIYSNSQCSVTCYAWAFERVCNVRLFKRVIFPLKEYIFSDILKYDYQENISWAPKYSVSIAICNLC